jgi:hypothetical protein
MMLSEIQIRTRIKELDQQDAQLTRFSHQLLLVRNNRSMAHGDPDKIKEVVAGLTDIKNQLKVLRGLVEATADAQLYARDKTNPTANGLLSNVRGKSKSVLARLDNLLNQIGDLLRNAGGGSSSASARLTVAMAKHLDNCYDSKTNKVDLAGVDSLVVGIAMLAALLKEWIRPSN